MDLFADAGVEVEKPAPTITLEEIRLTGRVKGKRHLAIAIAHGLAYDPHVDGRLRLTPVGRAALDRAPDLAGQHPV